MTMHTAFPSQIQLPPISSRGNECLHSIPSSHQLRRDKLIANAHHARYYLSVHSSTTLIVLFTPSGTIHFTASQHTSGAQDRLRHYHQVHFICSYLSRDQDKAIVAPHTFTSFRSSWPKCTQKRNHPMHLLACLQRLSIHHLVIVQRFGC